MKSPAFLFYSKDWIADTAELAPAEKGVYIDLLAHQHVSGTLPIDLSKLSRIARLPEGEFKKIWENLKSMFHQMDDRMVNVRLNEVIEVNNDRAVKNKINGHFAVAIRQLKQSDKIIREVKKSFDYKDFIETNESELKTKIHQWVDQMVDQLVNNIANVNEDVNEDVNYKGGTGGKKKKIQIPSLDEFLRYAKEKEPEYFEAKKHNIELKYKAWVESGWKNGYDKEIKNWKATLLNTLQHINATVPKMNGSHVLAVGQIHQNEDYTPKKTF
jgi:uncharacterized protein YdaU (DUF1376 family)